MQQNTQLSEQADALAEFRMGRLQSCEGVITRGLQTFIEVGEALSEIRNDRLYKIDGYTSFDSYLKIRWPGIGRSRASQIIAASEIVQNLESVYTCKQSEVPMPTSEAQVRPLNGMEKEDQAALWQLSVEAAGGEVPTAPQVRAVKNEVMGSATHERIGRLDTDRAAKSEPEPIGFSQDDPKPVKRRGFTATAIDYNRHCILGFYHLPENTAKGWPAKRINLWIDFASLEAVGCVMPSVQEIQEWKSSGGLSPDVAVYLKEKMDIARANAERDQAAKKPVQTTIDMLPKFFEEPTAEPEEPPLQGSFLPPDGLAYLDDLAKPFADDYPQ